MTATTFVKYYDDPRRAAAARAHHAWFAALDSDIRFPALLSTTPHSLEFEHLGDRHPGPGDLPVLAAALGRLHTAAHTSQLHAAQLDTPFTTADGLVIADFVTPRRSVLEKLPLPTAGLPVALYKDANIRNFILTETGPAIIDFDDLTLAPFGYDLAKLILSAAMTHGHLDPQALAQVLKAYNACAAAASGADCAAAELRRYVEFHHLCTARYLGSNGYRHPWPHVRPASWDEAGWPSSAATLPIAATAP